MRIFQDLLFMLMRSFISCYIMAVPLNILNVDLIMYRYTQFEIHYENETACNCNSF